MKPVDWLPDILSYPLYWLYLDQTLVAGGMAIIAAFITVRAIRDQISQQDKLEGERLKRRNRAFRAALPYALSEFMQYTDNCLHCIHELRRSHDEGFPVSNWSAPSYPVEAASKLSDTIECCDVDDAKKLAGILAWGQIYDARLSRYLQQPEDQVRVVPEVDFRQLYYDTLCFKKLVDRAYEYGRGRELHIEEICSVDAAISTLHVSFRVTDDVLDEMVRRRWPPEFHDYAEDLEDW